MRLSVALFLTIALAPPLPAAIPGADNPHTFTEHDYRKQVEAFNRRTMTNAYESVGHHDPKWDDDAIALLDAMAHHFAYAESDPPYRIADPIPLSKMEELGKSALAKGCDDPMVLDALSISMRDAGKYTDAKPLVRQAVDGLMESHYPVYRVSNAIRRAIKGAGKIDEADLRERYEQKLYDLDLATLKFAEFNAIDRRPILKWMKPEIDAWWTLDRARQFCEDAEKLDGDPWLTDMLIGLYHIRAGWDARGNKIAAEVTPDGWKGLEAHMALARKYLTAAQKLHPEYPEAASQMINVVMAGHAGAGETTRLWFDRAATAQIDFEEAYGNFWQSIWPRWGGSFDEELAFGQECAATERYDTRVPREFIRIVAGIYFDSGGDRSYLQKPGVFDKISDILTRTLQSRSNKTQRAGILSELAGLAWQAQRYDDGVKALDQLTGPSDWIGFDISGTPARRAGSGLYAMTGAHAGELKHADALVDAGKVNDAISKYQNVVSTVPIEDKSSWYIRGRTQELIWQRAFANGEWVDLQPNATQDGWYTERGGFAPTPGYVAAHTARGNGAQLICGAEFGPRWELKCNLDILANSSTAQAGILFNWIGSKSFRSVQICPASKQVTLFTAYDDLPPIDFKPQTSNAIDLTMWDNSIDVTVNGERVVKNYPFHYFTELQHTLIGIGSTSPSEGVPFRVSGLKIRKLITPQESGGKEN